MANRTKGPGTIGYYESADYIDDGTLCRARSPNPGVTGLDTPPVNPIETSGTDTKQETRESLKRIRIAADYIRENIDNFTQDSLDTVVGAVKGTAWAAETITTELLDSAKWLYNYIAEGKAREEMLLAALKYARYLSDTNAFIFGSDPISQPYEEVKKLLQKVEDVRGGNSQVGTRSACSIPERICSSV